MGSEHISPMCTMSSSKLLCIFWICSRTAFADLRIEPAGGYFLPRTDELPTYGFTYGAQSEQNSGGSYSSYKPDLELALLQQGSDKLGTSISSMLDSINGLADEARAAAVAQANEDNFQILVQQGFYIISYVLYGSSVVLGITAANAVGLIIDLSGRGITNTAYIYEALIGLVDVGDDCTVGNVNTDIADFRSDNTVLRPVSAYWVDVTEQLETIRCVSSFSITSPTLVSSCRTSLGC